MSIGRIRTARLRRLASRAKLPRPAPVNVMRCQKRLRGPWKVAVNATSAPARPSPNAMVPGPLRIAGAGTRRPSATNDAGEQDPGDEQRAEREVQAGGLEVDHRDGSSLSRGA